MESCFRHSGKLGDIIYSLPTVRSLGGGRLLLHEDASIGDRLTADLRASIGDLLRMQPYVTGVEDYHGQSNFVDLDVFRRRPVKENLALQHLCSFNLRSSEMDRRWLWVDRPHVVSGKNVVFNRSGQLHDPGFPWAEAVAKYREAAIFVGTAREHADFVAEFGKIDYYPTRTLADLARLIAACRLFVGNQSCPYAIAEGLKVNTIQESSPVYPNCIFPRANATYSAAGPIVLPDLGDGSPGAAELAVRNNAVRLPVFGFMHVAMTNHWKEIVEEQVLKMRASGLWEKTERLFVGLLGPRPDEFTFADPKILPMYFGVDYAPAELPTLGALQRFCRTQDCLVYYVHTKGAFSPGNGTRDWRRSMEHFAITRHEDCILALADHDVCGINWHSSWCRFFGGNFWWARADYVRSLPDILALEPISGRDLSRRHVCERWLGENPAVRWVSLHESDTDHYRDEYPRSRYAQVREVEPTDSFDCPGAWTGLENLFQDLIEPVAPVRRVVVVGVESGLGLFALASALPQATIIGIEESRDSPEPPAGSPCPGQWLDAHLPKFCNAMLLRMDACAAARALDGFVDVLAIHRRGDLEDLRRSFEAWEPKIRPGGCVLLAGIESRPRDVGRFFDGLLGRKAEIRKGAGLGAWYKPVVAAGL